jgi:MFS family permease
MLVLARSGPCWHLRTDRARPGLDVADAAGHGDPGGWSLALQQAELAEFAADLVLGVLADRYGAKPVLVAGLAVQAVAIAAYVFVSRLGEFYALSVVFGLAYGGVMPLYAVLARDYFGPKVMGTVLGAATMTSAIGMAFGPVGGGWLYDTFGSYHWLYVASAAVGLAAAAMALAFPPVRKPQEGQLQPA